MNAPEFVPGGGGGQAPQMVQIGPNMYHAAGAPQDWPLLQQQQQQPPTLGPQPPPQQSPVQFNQAPQFHYTPYVPQQPIPEVQTFAISQQMTRMSINNRLHQFHPGQPGAPGVGVGVGVGVPVPVPQPHPQQPPMPIQQPGGYQGIRGPAGGSRKIGGGGRPPLGGTQSYAQQVSNGIGGGGVPHHQQMGGGGHRQRGGRNGGFNHHNHHSNAQQNHHKNSATGSSTSPQGDGDDSHTPSEAEDSALCFLTEVISKIESNPGLFETYQKKMKEMFYDLASNNFVMSNALEMLFKQSTKSSNFRYMGARICNLLDELEPADDSLFRTLMRLKLEFEMQELMSFMQNEQHVVRGTTLFMAELYMQLRRPNVSGLLSLAVSST